MGLSPKKAFTLAEILINLGIIGVVAAITIPGLMTAYRRIAYPIQLKAIYSKLLVAQKTLNDEYGNPEDWTFTNYVTDSDDRYNLEIFKRYATELSAISTRDRGNYDYFENGLSPSAILLNGQPAKNISGWASGAYLFEGHHCRSMQLKNGAVIVMYFAQGTAGAVMWPLIKKKMYAAFLIDINGAAKPNIVGRDIFAFGLKGGSTSIVPYMDDTSDCNKQGAGLSCSRKIIQDEWKMNY